MSDELKRILKFLGRGIKEDDMAIRTDSLIEDAIYDIKQHYLLLLAKIEEQVEKWEPAYREYKNGAKDTIAEIRKKIEESE